MLKYVLLLLPSLCYSQSICDSLIATDKDRMTDKVSYGMKETIILSDDGKHGIGINLVKLEKTVALSIVVAEAGNSCIDDNTQIIFLYADDSKETVLSNNKFNCDGKANVYMGGGWGKSGLLSTLSTKQIKAIRVYTRKGYVDKEFTSKQGEQLKNAVACIQTK